VLEHNITPAHGDAAASDDFKIYFGGNAPRIGNSLRRDPR
jgi:hypothetical protein